MGVEHQSEDLNFREILKSAQVPQSPVNTEYRITESQNGRGWKGPLWVI